MGNGNVKGPYVTLKLWWAGHLIQTLDVEPEEVATKLKEFEEQVKKGTIKHPSCGTMFVVDELVVDAHGQKGWKALASFKNK